MYIITIKLKWLTDYTISSEHWGSWIYLPIAFHFLNHFTNVGNSLPIPAVTIHAWQYRIRITRFTCPPGLLMMFWTLVRGRAGLIYSLLMKYSDFTNLQCVWCNTSNCVIQTLHIYTPCWSGCLIPACVESISHSALDYTGMSGQLIQMEIVLSDCVE